MPHRMSAKAVGHRQRHLCAMMVIGAQFGVLLDQLSSHRSLVGLAWHVPQRPINSSPRSRAGAADRRLLSIAIARHKSSRRWPRSPWLICAQVMISQKVAGLCPGVPLGANTKALPQLPDAAPRRIPHSAAEATAEAATSPAAAVVADCPAMPQTRGSGLLSAEEERLCWLEARMSKLNARHAKVIADESRLHRQFRELAELKRVGDKVL